MKTTSAKNILVVIMVAIISSLVTVYAFNHFYAKSGKTVSAINSTAEIQEYADSFNQSENVRLASLTTVEGYPDFTEAAAKSVDGVVHVKVKSISQQQHVSPLDFFFGFGERNMQPREQIGFGSGVIISKDGYILTNNHVIEGATEVSVTLNNNKEYSAKVIGADPQTDIGLLKIEGNDFHYLSFGNSDALKVGEWVLAVGNPFNLTSTVTAGIVSAKNRGNVTSGGNDLGIQSFIQVDAAVNRGNSGGALVNTRGELVGINTAIFSQSGDFSGLAFAVPISIAGKIATDLKQFGAVQRAVLGILVPNIEMVRRQNPDKAQMLSQIEGVLIEDFADRSAAKAGGIEKEDIIKEINGAKIKSFASLQEQLSRYRPGDKVKVTVERKGKELVYDIELTNDDGNTEIKKGITTTNMLGAIFTEIPKDKKQKLGVSSGVEVAEVTANGLFKKEGIKKGFIIMRVNNAPVNSEADINKVVAAVNASSQDKVLLIAGFYPNGRTQYIAIDLTQNK